MAYFEDGTPVLVRTYSAGVHYGNLSGPAGKEIVLTNARRIWSWQGAFTLSEISLHGIVSGKVSAIVPVILLTEAIEIIPISSEAEFNLNSQPRFIP